MWVPQTWPAPGESQSGRAADRDRAGEGGGQVGTATQWGFLEVDPPQLSVCKERRYGKGIPGRGNRVCKGLGVFGMAASVELKEEEMWRRAGSQIWRGLGCLPKGPAVGATEGV